MRLEENREGKKTRMCEEDEEEEEEEGDEEDEIFVATLVGYRTFVVFDWQGKNEDDEYFYFT